MPRFTPRPSLRWRKPLTLPRFGASSPRRANHVRSKAAPLLLSLLITLLVFAIFVFWMESHIRPLLLQMAEERVHYLASQTINEAIEKRLLQDQVQYENLVYFDKDLQGQITALRTNMMAINRLKVNITEDILAGLKHMGSSELSIPLGSVVGGDFFSGRGPKIPIRIVPLGTVSAEFSNKFTAAGINQTRHQIMLDITVDMSLLLIGSACSRTVRVQMSIAETVIVGAVPDTYLTLENSGSEP